MCIESLSNWLLLLDSWPVIKFLSMQVPPLRDENGNNSFESDFLRKEDAQSSSSQLNKQRFHMVLFIHPSFLFLLRDNTISNLVPGCPLWYLYCSFFAFWSFCPLMFYPIFLMLVLSCFHIFCSIHPPPTFGSFLNLEALALEDDRTYVQDGDRVVKANRVFSR